MWRRRLLNPHPKPAKSEPKPRKPIRRTRVKTRRTKARPGRLKDEEMSALRKAAFERDGGICQYCFLPCSETGWDLAHVRGKRMWGDRLDNVRVKHERCHRIIEHAYGPSGIKPCKKKERAA